MSPEPRAELAEHVRRVVDGFRPLSAEQRDKVAALLRCDRPPAPAVPAQRKRRRQVVLT
ncbi:MAG: hypothetical protein ACRDQU_05690 [Pseudonocardiaceae bacterium]